MAKVTINFKSNCGTPYIHQPVLIQLSVGNTWIPPEPMSFPNDDAPDEGEGGSSGSGGSGSGSGGSGSGGGGHGGSGGGGSGHGGSGGSSKRGSPKLSVAKMAEAVRKAVEKESDKRGSPVSGVDRTTSASSGSTKGTTTTFSFSFEAKGEVDIGVCGTNGSTQMKVSVDVQTDDGETFRVKILKDDDVRKAHRNHAWAGNPDDHVHSTEKLGGANVPGTKKTIDVVALFGSPASGLGAYAELAPAFEGGLSAESAPGPSSAQFGEAVPIGGGWSPSARYYADGFYYRRDLAAGATGDDIALASVGFAPGSLLSGRGEGPRAARAQLRGAPIELQPVTTPTAVRATVRPTEVAVPIVAPSPTPSVPPAVMPPTLLVKGQVGVTGEGLVGPEFA